MKNNIFKKVLAGFAAFAMVATMMPAMTAQAAAGDVTLVSATPTATDGTEDPDNFITAKITSAETDIALYNGTTTAAVAVSKATAGDIVTGAPLFTDADAQDLWLMVQPGRYYEYTEAPKLQKVTFAAGGWKAAEKEIKDASLTQYGTSRVYSYKIAKGTFNTNNIDAALQISNPDPVMVTVNTTVGDGVTVKTDKTNYAINAEAAVASGDKFEFVHNTVKPAEKLKTDTVKADANTVVLHARKDAKYGRVVVKVNDEEVAIGETKAGIAVAAGADAADDVDITLTRNTIVETYATPDPQLRDENLKNIKLEISYKANDGLEIDHIYYDDTAGDYNKDYSTWKTPYVYRDENGDVVVNDAGKIPTTADGFKVSKQVQGGEYKFTVELDNTVEATASNGKPVVKVTSKSDNAVKTLTDTDGVYTIQLTDPQGYEIKVEGWKDKATGKILFTPDDNNPIRFDYFVPATGFDSGFATQVGDEGTSDLSPSEGVAGAPKPWYAVSVPEGEYKFKIKFAGDRTGGSFNDDTADDKYGLASLIKVTSNGTEIKADDDGVYTVTVVKDEETVIAVEGVVTLWQVTFPNQNGFKVEVEDSVSVRTDAAGKKFTVIEDEKKFRFKLVPDDGVDMSDATVKILETTGGKDDANSGTALGLQPDGWYEFIVRNDTIINVIGAFANESHPFDDVNDPDKMYFYDAVVWAKAQGVTTGIGNNLFGVNGTLTRAQAVTFLYAYAGKPAATTESKFTDIADVPWAKDAINWAAAEGVTSGTSETTFDPNATVTRGQAMAFLFKVAKGSENAKSSFSDVAEGSMFYKQVSWAAENKISVGVGNNEFGVNTPVTRESFVQWIYLCDQLPAPAEETPAEETPAEETPAEEATP